MSRYLVASLPYFYLSPLAELWPVAPLCTVLLVGVGRVGRGKKSTFIGRPSGHCRNERTNQNRRIIYFYILATFTKQLFPCFKQKFLKNLLLEPISPLFTEVSNNRHLIRSTLEPWYVVFDRAVEYLPHTNLQGRISCLGDQFSHQYDAQVGELHQWIVISRPNLLISIKSTKLRSIVDQDNDNVQHPQVHCITRSILQDTHKRQTEQNGNWRVHV